MLFSLNRVLLPVIGVLALLQSTVAYPVPNGSLVDNKNVVEHNEALENAVLGREFIDLRLLEARDIVVDESILERNWPDRRGGRGQITKERKANPYKPKAKGPASAPAKKVQPQNNQNKRKALPTNTKLRLGDDARGELNKMGLHGKARKETIKWHKNEVKKQMRTNPALKGKAYTGVIQHLAHKGGSDPKEKNHITASFLDKHRQPVPNKFNGGNNHHLYVKSNKGLPRQAKAGWNKNNAEIKGQSRSHQTSLSKTHTPGKSSNKGRGKQNPGNNFSKNPNKGFQKKGRK